MRHGVPDAPVTSEKLRQYLPQPRLNRDHGADMLLKSYAVAEMPNWLGGPTLALAGDAPYTLGVSRGIPNDTCAHRLAV